MPVQPSLHILLGTFDRLDSVRWYFSRRLFNASYKPYMEHLPELQLGSLEMRRFRADVILVYTCYI